jgi:predicted amidophosphoribosyltransferase
MGSCIDCGKWIKDRYTRCYKCNKEFKEENRRSDHVSYEDQVLNDNYFGRGNW